MKKDWELNRLKALKEEEERRAELEEDEMLYTYSRDDAYQQVKRRNKQLALEARRVAMDSSDRSLSPRKAGCPTPGDVEASKKKQWVYKTPKIIKDLVRNRNVPVGAREEDINKKKSKVKIRVDDDSNEDIDVETVDAVEEILSRQKIKTKPDKPAVKRQRKSKGDTPVKASRSAVFASAVCSTETTKLDSLPGFCPATQREGIFEKLHSPSKVSASRANIFEQFGLQPPAPAALTGINVVQHQGQPQVLQNALGGSTVRLINTPQGQKMVVVSSGSVASPQPNPHNVVLLQGMQGFTQGIVIGNNIVSLQGTPLNVAPVARAGTPVNIQSPRLVGTPQVLSHKYGARIVAPVAGGVQPNPALVQRFVTGQRVNANLLQGTAVQVSQLSQTNPPCIVNSVQQLANIPQLRLSSPLVHTSGGQLVSLQQNSTPQRKPVQTIASLIAAGKAGKQPQHVASPPVSVSQPVQTSKPPINLASLANIMRAQLPTVTCHSSTPVPTQSQVRVNPTVAKLVASHIHSVCSNASQTTSSQSPAASNRSANPAVVSSTTRSQSPTVVKVVSVSTTATPVSSLNPGKAPSGSVQRGDNPVATINIKGLPPGVSIPASLVNSLVSGSIGGMSKGTVRGVVPQGSSSAQAPKKTVVRLTNPAETALNSHPAVTPVVQNNSETTPVIPKFTKAEVNSPNQTGRGISPVTANASPSTMQAWSNPNLVIRTRKAALKNPVAVPRSPQAGLPPVALTPSMGTGSPKSNGPVVTVSNHVNKSIQQVNVPLVVQDTQVNRESGNPATGVDVIEIQ